jgi:hypothetical protein
MKDDNVLTIINIIIQSSSDEGIMCKEDRKFETPGPMTDSHGNITGEKIPLVSIVDDSPKPKDSMPKYLKEMEKHGLKITSFTTTEER